MRANKFSLNSFYCINCGNKVLELPRPQARQRKTAHRKKLYCPHCQKEINCVECKNDEDIFSFKSDFSSGLYKGEAEESVRCCN